MSLLKIIPPDSWDFGERPASLVKMSNRGLTGRDRSVLEKRAGSEFADLASQVKLAGGDVPLHVIAMGSTEGFGSNRNGDGWCEASLKKYANTFEKYARWYRSHQNKNPEKSYGVVKLAHYNLPMRRVELLVLLNGTKEAADRNGGLVADEELSDLESGKDISASMAAKLAFDICVACDNRARTRKDYCKSAEEGGSCARFGCATGLTKVADDGFVQYVDNPDPTFFDISKVVRPADPIAWGAAADYLKKAASRNDRVVGGAELAEQYSLVPPLQLALKGVTDEYTANQIKLAYRLAEIENGLDCISGCSGPSLPRRERQRSEAMALAFHPAMQPAMDLAPLGKIGSRQFASGLNALAGQGVMLSPRDFASLLANNDVEKTALLADQLRGALPGAFNRLLATTDLVAQTNPFRPSRDLAPTIQRQWAQKCAATHSIFPERVQLRAALAAIRNAEIPANNAASLDKSASYTAAAIQLADMYALYKLAFLAQQDSNVTLTSELVVRQN